jgi:hypothetical protein
MQLAIGSLVVVIGAIAAACNNSSDVSRELGARCTQNTDCDDHCLSGSAWPAGLCTTTCDSDEDCPDIAHCIAEDGGSCAFGCGSDADCAFLGSGYGCHAVAAEAGSAEVMVCRGE